MSRPLFNKEEFDLEEYIKDTLFGTWKAAGKQLGEGGFGKVFKVEDVKNPSTIAAIKIECRDEGEAGTLQQEVVVLKKMNEKGAKEHFPMLLRASKRSRLSYMVISYLGKDLETVKRDHFPSGMPLTVLTKVGIQMLVAIKALHDAGFVHRDIKPANFAFGDPTDPTKARVVHILDFGIARQFTVVKKDGTIEPRVARPHIDFRGSLVYASPSMHDGMELGRKDDLWSWLYSLVELRARLPWSGSTPGTKLKTYKQSYPDADLMVKMPGELAFIPAHLRSLTVYSRPHYVTLHEALQRVFIRVQAAWTDGFPWETTEQAEKNGEHSHEFEDAEGTLMADPVGIDGGPSTRT